MKKDEYPWSVDMSLFAELKELQELHLQGNHIGELISPGAKFSLFFCFKSLLLLN